MEREADVAYLRQAIMMASLPLAANHINYGYNRGGNLSRLFFRQLAATKIASIGVGTIGLREMESKPMD